MTLSIEDLRFAVNDARLRLQNQLETIAAGDRQALGLLQLYVALSVASLSGAAAILLAQTAAWPRPLGFGLAGFALAISAGAVCALITLWPSNIRIAGRKPDFWQWADRSDVSPEHALREYLADITTSLAINGRTHARNAITMLLAKCAGAAAPVIGVAAGLLGYFLT